MLYSIFLILIGFALLMGGAEYLVKGAVAIANKIKIPTIIVGLTIVTFGISIPELIVSIKISLIALAGTSLGIIIGSNTANILLILGITALISPIKCRRRIFLRDYKFLFIVSILLCLFALSGSFSRWHSVIFLGLLATFVYQNYHNTKQEDIAEETSSPLANKSWIHISTITLAGLISIIYGTDILIKGASTMARILGVSEEIIGITIDAVRTSLPELATTVLATIRRQTGIALGNIVGSNILNIIFIMGTTPTFIDVVFIPKEIIYYDSQQQLFISSPIPPN